MPLNDFTVIKQIYNINMFIGLLQQQWFLRWPKNKNIKYYK